MTYAVNLNICKKMCKLSTTNWLEQMCFVPRINMQWFVLYYNVIFLMNLRVLLKIREYLKLLSKCPRKADDVRQCLHSNATMELQISQAFWYLLGTF